MDNPRLFTERNLWLATVRPNGKPHLIPIWFVWFNERAYLCTPADSVKVRNLRNNPRASIALEDGNAPVIGEGAARVLSAPFDPALLAVFKAKYDWDIAAESTAHAMIEIAVERWLKW